MHVSHEKIKIVLIDCLINLLFFVLEIFWNLEISAFPLAQTGIPLLMNITK